jgi:hypothetical protein
VSVTLPDSSAVDEALLQALRTDTTLAALMPGGVYWDVGPSNLQAFVAVSLIEASDRYTFQAANGEELETLTYEVKAVVLETSGQDALRPAAARIHEILQGGLLTIDGFDCLAVLRQGRIRRTSVDLLNDLRWLHRGGRYQVTVQPLPTPAP